MENMKIYVSENVEYYKNTIIGYLGNASTADLLLHIVQRCHICDFYEDNWDTPVVLSCSGMVYVYYSNFGFLSIKHNKEGKYIHEEVFNNIPNVIKNIPHFKCLQDGFVMYNDKELF